MMHINAGLTKNFKSCRGPEFVISSPYALDTSAVWVPAHMLHSFTQTKFLRGWGSRLIQVLKNKNQIHGLEISTVECGTDLRLMTKD